MRKIALGSFFVVSMLCLSFATGCTPSNHQIINSQQACTECHSSRYAFDDASLSKVTDVTPTVIVSTKESTLWICKVHPAQKDGSYVVPEKVSEVAVAGGQATIELDEGVWALCVGDKLSPTTVLVRTVSTGASTISL